MCWVCKSPRKRIARTNIHVFKLVYYNKKRDAISSAYACFKYQLNQLYVISDKINFRTTTFGSKLITKGVFHSYKYSRIICRIRDRFLTKDKNVLVYSKSAPNATFNATFNNYVVIDGFDMCVAYNPDYKLYVMKCIIPIGTTYYLNPMGCYISNAIKPYQLINIEDYVKLSEHYKRK